MTSGDNNICIGYLAGTTLTSGQGNIIIGNNLGATTNGSLTESLIVSGKPIVFNPSHNHAYFSGFTKFIFRDLSTGAGGTLEAAAYNNLSDNRMKEDVVEIQDAVALENMRLLKPCQYTLVSDPERGAVFGFLAQEIQAVLPSIVSESSGTVPFSTAAAVVDVISEHAYVLELESMSEDIEAGNTMVLDSNIVVSIELVDGLMVSVTHNDHELEVGTAANVTHVGVQDLLSVQPMQIVSVLTSACQEIDRLLQSEIVKTAQLQTDLNAEKIKVAELQANDMTDILVQTVGQLEQDLAAEKTRTATLEQQNAAILARLDDMEARLQALESA